jgi:Protein of unknown function (DUF3995)
VEVASCHGCFLLVPVNRAAIAAAVLAFGYAVPNLYWTLGGEALLSTVGGTIEDTAGRGGAMAVAVGLGSAGLKVLGGMLALALAFPSRHRLPLRPLRLIAAAASGFLVLYGGLLVVVGSLVLIGVIHPSTPVDRSALAWHVWVWDMWFLIWGLLLGLAVHGTRRPTRDTTPRDR